MEEKNEYLGQVLAQQAKVDQELRRSRAPAAPALPGAADSRSKSGDLDELTRYNAASAPADGGRAVDYRVTGFWLWQTVVVPPNVYVIHTRRGHPQPVTIGLGMSFRFNPYRDAFLLVPAAMQTIIINARCICSDRQGVLVQAYVQWIVDDVRVAYRRLDFSDPQDPMRVVNVQLREQAEAAIKDKVSTMGIDDVLSDKQPIIAELTHRLRWVAEGGGPGTERVPAVAAVDEGIGGAGAGGGGLGLKIVTVQIKEAVVSSTRLWENLQKPFRAERERVARLAELEAQQLIAARELENQQARQSAELEAETRLAELRAAKELERYGREQAEKVRRHQIEQQAEQQALAERNETEKARKQAELDLALKALELDARRVAAAADGIRRQAALDQAAAEQQRAQAAAEMDVQELRSKAADVRRERKLTALRSRRQIENDASDGYLRMRLIDQLPGIAQALPKPDELRSVTIAPGGDGASNAGALAGFVTSLLHLVREAARPPAATDKAPATDGRHGPPAA